MGCAHVLGEFPFEFSDVWPLAHPAASERRDERPFFLLAEGRPGEGNVFRRGNGAHETSTTAGVLAAFLHRISSRSPCSKETVARNPSILSAFSTDARRLCTLPTRRATRYSGCREEPVIFRSMWQRSFKQVCTPVP